MQKKGRRTCGAECGGDLLGNDAALAHTGDHDAAVFLTAAKDQLEGVAEGFGHGAFKALGEGFESGCFRADQCGRLQTASIRIAGLIP